MGSLRMYVVVDNWVQKKGFIAEHGLSLLIEYDGQRLLFDTGQGMALVHNLNRLHLSPDTLHKVILSHGHFDHGDGLKALVERNPRLLVYAHPQVFVPQLVKRKTGYLPAGFSYSQAAMEEKGVRFLLQSRPHSLGDSFLLTGEIPQKNPYEETGEDFYLPNGEGGYRRNLLPDDQALIINTPRGLVVILGCSHRGVINTLDYAVQLMETAEIFGVVGGMHLCHAEEEKIERTIMELRRYNIQRLLPMHCSGFKARMAMAQAFPHAFQETAAGLTFADFLA